MALFDKDADEETRLDGALLVTAFMRDVAMIRSIWFKQDGD